MRPTLLMVPILGLSVACGCNRTEPVSTSEAPGAVSERSGSPPSETASSPSSEPVARTGSEDVLERDYLIHKDRVEVDPILLERQPVAGRSIAVLEQELQDRLGRDW